jgi:hypothetical protein
VIEVAGLGGGLPDGEPPVHGCGDEVEGHLDVGVGGQLAAVDRAPQDGGPDRTPLLADRRPDGLCHLRVACTFGREVGEDPREPGVDEPLVQCAEDAEEVTAQGPGVGCRGQFDADVPQHSHDHLLLGGPAPVERALADARPPGDGLHGELAVTGLGQLVEHRFGDRLGDAGLEDGRAGRRPLLGHSHGRIVRHGRNGAVPL